MNVIIRNENPSDYKIVENLIRECFWNLYFPGCNEHLSAHQLRNSDDFLPNLTYVLEIDNQIMGVIFYSKSSVINKDETKLDTITFGPVCIHPSLHRQGFGKMLITHSINKARELGYNAILTLGYPYHYRPYGFVGARKFNIAMEDGNFYKGLLALELYDGALDDLSGFAVFSSALNVDESDLEKFDLQFPVKEKGYMPSQTEFENTIGLLDE